MGSPGDVDAVITQVRCYSDSEQISRRIATRGKASDVVTQASRRMIVTAAPMIATAA